MRYIILFAMFLMPHTVIGETPDQDSRAIDCLAKNMYYEARGEILKGIKAVGHVTMNRVKANGFPNSVCGVVTQKIKSQCQFSWVCMKSLPRIRQEIYDDIKQMAEEIYYGESHDPTKGATHFHSKHINPGWSKHKRTANIGNHVFYKA